jgi:hypothetical protein
LDQTGQTRVPCHRPVLARMACQQQPRRPQLVRIAMVLGLVAGQRYQPSLAAAPLAARPSSSLH